MVWKGFPAFPAHLRSRRLPGAQTQPLSRPVPSVGSAGVRLSRRRVVRTALPLGTLPLARPAGRPSSLTCLPAGPGGQGTASTAAPPDSRSGPQPEPEADGVMRQLPYFCRGQVVRGFGRGSKQLGIPTGERRRARSPRPALGWVTWERSWDVSRGSSKLGRRTTGRDDTFLHPGPPLLRQKTFGRADGARPYSWLRAHPACGVVTSES